MSDWKRSFLGSFKAKPCGLCDRPAKDDEEQVTVYPTFGMSVAICFECIKEVYRIMKTNREMRAKSCEL